MKISHLLLAMVLTVRAIAPALPLGATRGFDFLAISLAFIGAAYLGFALAASRPRAVVIE